jgi:hypothetical protein
MEFIFLPSIRGLCRYPLSVVMDIDPGSRAKRMRHLAWRRKRRPRFLVFTVSGVQASRGG